VRAVYLIPGVIFALLAANICACVDGDPQPVAVAAPLPDINTSVFVCNVPAGEPFQFTVRLGPGELAAWLPLQFGRPYLVLAERGAGNAREFAEGDVVIRLYGQRADLVVDGERFTGCLRNAARSVWEHAKLSGVDFRATGSMPDWTLEIKNKRQIWLQVPADGVDLQAVADEVENAGIIGIYRAPTASGALEIQIGGAVCAVAGVDGTTVAVFLDGAMYSGCGRALH